MKYAIVPLAIALVIAPYGLNDDGYVLVGAAGLGLLLYKSTRLIFRRGEKPGCFVTPTETP